MYAGCIKKVDKSEIALCFAKRLVYFFYTPCIAFVSVIETIVHSINAWAQIKGEHIQSIVVKLINVVILSQTKDE